MFVLGVAWRLMNGMVSVLAGVVESCRGLVAVGASPIRGPPVGWVVGVSRQTRRVVGWGVACPRRDRLASRHLRHPRAQRVAERPTTRRAYGAKRPARPGRQPPIASSRATSIYTPLPMPLPFHRSLYLSLSLPARCFCVACRARSFLRWHLEAPCCSPWPRRWP